MHKNGSKWIKTDQNESKQIRIDNKWLTWIKMNQNI